MTLSLDERNALVNYRVTRAHNTMDEVEKLVGIELWHNAAGRLYYAAFYMASALLISHNLQAQTHSGVLTLIGLHFVKNGILSHQDSKQLTRLFELRQESDYGTFLEITAEDVLTQIEPTRNLLKALEALITT